MKIQERQRSVFGGASVTSDTLGLNEQYLFRMGLSADTCMKDVHKFDLLPVP